MDVIPRGALVEYKGGIWIFQPNGNTCYLYANATLLGQTKMATCTARVDSIKRYYPVATPTLEDPWLPMGGLPSELTGDIPAPVTSHVDGESLAPDKKTFEETRDAIMRDIPAPAPDRSKQSPLTGMGKRLEQMAKVEGPFHYGNGPSNKRQGIVEPPPLPPKPDPVPSRLIFEPVYPPKTKPEVMSFATFVERARNNVVRIQDGMRDEAVMQGLRWSSQHTVREFCDAYVGHGLELILAKHYSSPFTLTFGETLIVISLISSVLMHMTPLHLKEEEAAAEKKSKMDDTVHDQYPSGDDGYYDEEDDDDDDEDDNEVKKTRESFVLKTESK